FFSSRRRHTRFSRDWSSDVCSSDLFMAVGAYSSAIMARQWGMSFWLALPLSALFTGGIGLIFGLPSLRVKGFYLAMATLAAQFKIGRASCRERGEMSGVGAGVRETT